MRSTVQGLSSRSAILACGLALIFFSGACGGGGGGGGTGGKGMGGLKTDGGVGGQGGVVTDGGQGDRTDGSAGAGDAADAGMDGADGGSLPLGLPWTAFLPLGAAAPGSSAVVGTTSDLTANHFDATYYGTTITFTNAALNLTGLASELVLIPPKNSVPAVDVTRSYSVSVWVTLADVGGFRTVVSGEGVTIASFFLQKRADTNAWAFTIPPNDSLAPGGCVIPNGPVDGGPTPHPITPVANTLYHLVATHDSTTGLSILYVDGVESGRGPCPLGWADTGVVGIGHGLFNSGRGDNVLGSIAELGLINRVLTPTEVANLFAAGGAGGVHPDAGVDVTPDVAPDATPDVAPEVGAGDAGPADAPADSPGATDAAADGG